MVIGYAVDLRVKIVDAVKRELNVSRKMAGCMAFGAPSVARKLLRIWPGFVDQHVEIWNA